MRLDGRRAAITGAGRGIGKALACALAAAGAEVTLIARSTDEIDELAEAIKTDGGSTMAKTLDMLDLDAVIDFFRAAPAFHILVNNAGTNRPKPLGEVTLEDYDAVMDLNVRSCFFAAKAASDQMVVEDVAGSLIHIGSQMGHVGGPNRSLYCTSKWALEGMNKAMALDLAPHGIRSNIIAPTFIETPLTKPFFEDAGFKASILEKIKLGRIGQPEDLMGAVLFLASDASAMMTGSSMVIDGGWTAE
jgi:NAD(P)-dependent dehydrogenase (short-subunit alcohol dehydrogenase family)